MDEATIQWTEYMMYRVRLRGFDVAKVEQIMRYSGERCLDTATNRLAVVGRHDERLVMVLYEQVGDTLTPVTIHATSRQQINFRVKSGRFRNE